MRLTRIVSQERKLLQWAVVLMGAVGVLCVSAQDQWGDIPPEELKGMVLYDFIKGTEEEERTLGALKMLEIEPQRPLLAVFYRGSKTSELPNEKRGISVIMEGPCSIEFVGQSRALKHYEALARKDIPPLAKVAFTEIARDEAEALARRLGGALGLDLSEVRTEVRLDGEAVWDVQFTQLIDGYLCPGNNGFSVAMNANSNTIRFFMVRPFITKAHTKIVVDKAAAVKKACEIAETNYDIYKGKEVAGSITIDKPWMQAVGVERDESGKYLGQIGRLAWPVYMEGSLLILYIDCETGELLRDVY